MTPPPSKLEHLDTLLRRAGRMLVAYSGGVDSAFLLSRAVHILGSEVRALIADSPSLPRSELAAARRLAEMIGAPLDVVATQEFTNPDYTSNPVNRCYFCKAELFLRMEAVAQSSGFPVLAYGENADDMQQIRPGRRAAEEFLVQAPLRDAGLTKAEIRDLSRRAGLPTADKPASPCLSSRVPHGTAITPEMLAQIEQGEEALRSLGFRVFRLRHHGTLARLEFAGEEFNRFDDAATRHQIEQLLHAAGYASVERAPHPYGRPVPAPVMP